MTFHRLLLLSLALTTATSSLLPGSDHHGHHHGDGHGHHHHHDGDGGQFHHHHSTELTHHLHIDDHTDHDHQDGQFHHVNNDHVHQQHHTGPNSQQHRQEEDETQHATGREAIRAAIRIHELYNGVSSDRHLPSQLPTDMPALREVPKDISFTCNDKPTGYYADVDYRCQVYHVCRTEHSMKSFLCPNSTVFNQSIFACDWWFNVDCSLTHSYYHRNSALYQEGPVEPRVGQQEAVQHNRVLGKSTSEAQDSHQDFNSEFGEFLAVFQGSEDEPTIKQEQDVKHNELLRKSIVHSHGTSSDFLAIRKSVSAHEKASEGGGTGEVQTIIHPQSFFITADPPSSKATHAISSQTPTVHLPPPTPSNGYLPPINGYLPPVNDYLPPTKDYLPPTNEYLPPTNQ